MRCMKISVEWHNERRCGGRKAEAAEREDKNEGHAAAPCKYLEIQRKEKRGAR